MRESFRGGVNLYVWITRCICGGEEDVYERCIEVDQGQLRIYVSI